MSHTVEIELEINDLDALADAASNLGGALVRDRTTFRQYFERDNECDHVLTFPGCRYEIGVQANDLDDSRGFSLKCDWFGNYLTPHVGKEGELLKREYAAAVAWRHYSKLGYTINRSTNQNGEIVLEARK